MTKTKVVVWTLCEGCRDWYTKGHTCAGAADGLPIEDIEHSLNRLARAFERIAAALENDKFERW
jgi:hypothetical protein